MTIIPILIAPHPVLRQKAAGIQSITKETERLLDDMLATMYDAPGIGLAAPQIGQSLRLVTIDLGERSGSEDGKITDPLKMINPEIIGKSKETSIYEEGCLSIPGVSAEVTRPERIKLRYTDLKGKLHEIDADGLLATCIQHEIDHLNGVLFIDYLSKLKRDVIMRKMKKLQAERTGDPSHDPTHDL